MEAKVVVNGLIKIDKHWHGQNFPVEIVFGYLEVVRLMNLQDFGLSRVEFFFVKDVLNLVDYVIFHFYKVPKEENKVAHNLAFLGILFWILLDMERCLSSSNSSLHS